MAILLCRVDERLIHGQVTVAWGGYLHPLRYVVVDDRLAASEWEREMYRLGVPVNAAAEFLTAAEGRAALPRLRAEEEGVFVLTRDLLQMEELLLGAAEGETVNLGGMYSAPGREEVLPYVWLSEEDRERIRRLLDAGIEVNAQDLPISPAVEGRALLDA